MAQPGEIKMEKERLTTVSNRSSDARSVIIDHVTSLVSEQNFLMDAKIEYVETGRVTEGLESVMVWMPSGLSERKSREYISSFIASKIDLPDFQDLTDAEVVEFYSVVILKLAPVYVA
jgi:hypothetical protein